MVLDKDYVKRKYVPKTAAAPIPTLLSEDFPSRHVLHSRIEHDTYSTSAIASSETATSLSAQDTLSMVSTPWSTETWNTYTVSEEGSLDEECWLSTDPTSSATLVPATSTSYGVTTAFNSKNSSRRTLTLLSGDLTSSASFQIEPIKSEHSNASFWTMETFTSSGILSEANILRVKYPWSPCTSVMSGSELYPSSLESYESRKVSRVSVSGTPVERDSLTPMNYNFHGKQDKDPIVDWLLMKLKGIEMGVHV